MSEAPPLDRLLLDAHHPEERSYLVGGDWEPLATVGIGEPFWLRTLDASGNQVTPCLRSVADLDPARLFPVTGPISVRGVEPGDAVGIEVLAIEPVREGHLWTRPGLGFGPAPDFHVWSVDAQELAFDLAGRSYRLAPQLHIGTLGVAPTAPTAARDVGRHGGNIDSVALRVGSILWLRAEHPGAGIFTGDVHAAIGDAEICGTGIEVEARLGLRVHRREHGPELPVIRNGARTWIIGSGATFEEALDEALRSVHDALVQRLGVAPEDAYLAMGALLEVRVCQVVNPHTSIAVSLGSGLDEALTDL